MIKHFPISPTAQQHRISFIAYEKKTVTYKLSSYAVTYKRSFPSKGWSRKTIHSITPFSHTASFVKKDLKQAAQHSWYSRFATVISWLSTRIANARGVGEHDGDT